MARRLWGLCLCLCLLTFPALSAGAGGKALPPGFVHADQVVPGLVEEMRYAGAHNFVGAPVDGYQAPRCILTVPAARALAAVQAELKPMGLGLKVYDCYRPVRAVSHFVRWARDLGDTKTKTEFYPKVDKARLFELGFIAERSSHNRGSTVDLTVVPLPPPPQPAWDPSRQVSCDAPAGRRYADNSLDMGSGFDCFDPVSHTESRAVPAQARANRLLLRSLMARHGFMNLAEEWWHYTLAGEPFPDTYFDFPVR